MFLFELFSSSEDTSMMNDFRQLVIDMLIPMVANRVKEISVNQIMDYLQKSSNGVVVDRALVMQVIDPNKIGPIEKVEGDRVYLDVVGSPDRLVDDDQKKDDQDHISDMALSKAKETMRE
jgi:hypothetical protein